jgi:hypothetical protein
MSRTVKRYATLGSNNNSSGTAAWTNPSNVGTDAAATCTLNAGATSQLLMATGFGFEIPFGAKINGIEYAMETSSTGLSLIRETGLQALKENTLVGAVVDFGLVSWLLSFLEKVIGDATDLHGTTWNSAEINSSGFGVSVQVENVGILQATASVKNLYARVTYDPPRQKGVFGGIMSLLFGLFMIGRPK